MCIIQIKLNQEEERTLNKYAELFDMPLSTLFKKALEEKIENEIDMKSIEEYEKKVKDGSLETYSFDEVKKMLDL
ncbi:type II toxin-antitoxin system RelB family antitoxin [Tissierella creatinophila]|uniref:Uncharacterized protein n=1 Tax=Tissierella creatinophila DSM 6911 TaxID=1123403 RepID=A0A1U7M576_TISCR|nr:DUF6290 family protein [Tissierella creatinophila]OLS02474.1 hypothetical protein TICRE_15550 [Tissierella creatinophila DSM 6911]